jgi:hypothetical protein
LTGTGAKPTGTVTFFNGSNSLGTGTLNSNGVATLAVTNLPAGTDSIKAGYGGDANYATATSAAVSVTVAKATQTIKFTAPSLVTYGVSPITLSATGGASGLPVTFTATGRATLTNSTLTITGAGSVVVTANQAGNSNYAAATAVQQTIKVGKAAAAATLTPSATTIAPNTSITFTARLTGPGVTAPSGSVTFLDGTTSLGAGTLASGVATYSTTRLTTGKHSVTVKFAGDNNYLPVTSAAVSITVAAK